MQENIYRLTFLVVAGEHDYPSCSLWRHEAFLPVKGADVTMKGLAEVSGALYRYPLALTIPFLAFLPLQCWNCCWLLWEWRDQWRYSPADLLAAPCKPHCGRCPGPGKCKGRHPHKWGVREWADFLGTSSPESVCACISAFFLLLLVSKLRDVLKFPLMEWCFLQLF